MEAVSTASDKARSSADWRRNLARRLLRWFDRHARPLPWRASRDPYRIWLSEVMLQQTQVATVVGYYERFVAALPTIADLAAADEQQVLKLWEGLGYYRRARQLHAAARQICQQHDGEFPTDREAVHALPGVGRYTAGAVLSIAFDAREPILEANTIRVLSRLLSYRGDPRSAAGQQRLWQAATDWLPRRRAGAFNQALMELGSEICTPRDPRCDDCPVALLCPTRAAGLQNKIPAPARKPRIEAVHQAAVVVRRRDGRLLLTQYRRGQRWAGLWDFPRFQLDGVAEPPVGYLEQQTATLAGRRVTLGERLLTLRHGVTRFRITLDCYTAQAGTATRSVASAERSTRAELAPIIGWFNPRELAALPMNTTGRKIARALAPESS
ncbi:MAG: A/G-specific adenine glycosylase [Pirellulales bacterium]